MIQHVAVSTNNPNEKRNYDPNKTKFYEGSNIREAVVQLNDKFLEMKGNNKNVKRTSISTFIEF